MSGEATPSGDAGEGTSKAVETTSGAAPATSGGAAPARAAAPAPAPPAYTGPPQPKPIKQRVPAWAMPVLVALPLWAILYAGAFGERETEVEGPLAVGASIYRSSGCSGCHGPNGQGSGSFPGLTEVTQTFPNFEDHVAWVENGSAPVKGQPYGATGRIASGGMPAFKDSLTEEEIIAVVCHERVEFGHEEVPPQCEADAAADGEEGASTGAEAGH